MQDQPQPSPPPAEPTAAADATIAAGAMAVNEIPSELPVLPLRDAVMFPIGVVPLQVARPQALQLLDDAMRGGRLLGIVAQRQADTEWPGPEEVYTVGTVARVVQLLRQPEGGLMVAVQGVERFRVAEWTGEQPYLRARITPAPEMVEESPELEA